MAATIPLARIIGPYITIIAIGVLVNLSFYKRMMEDFFKNTALIYLGGVLALIFGLLIVWFHNVWVAGWPVIITIFGWAGIIKGAWLIILPNSLGKMVELYKKHTALLIVQIIIMLALGIFLTIMGYFVG